MHRNHVLFALAAATVFAACAKSGDGSGDADDGGQAANPTTSGTGASTQGGNGQGAGPGSGGGGMNTNAGGAGGMGGDGGTTTTSTTTGNTCLHDICDTGPALTVGCGDPCVDTVCLDDPYCCDIAAGEWDEVCIEGAVLLCGANCLPPPSSVAPGDLVITEIMNNPAQVADAAGEWFEIYNDSFNAIDLLGLQIAHQANSPGSVEAITQSVVLQPGDYAVLAINANPATNGNVSVDYQYSTTVNLNNTADYLAILDGNSVVIDEVSYDQASGLDPSGATRSLDPLHQLASDNDTDSNFCEASSTMLGGTDLGTPGGLNDSCP
jgi:hypothetical protein